jgi:hypothetical protein
VVFSERSLLADIVAKGLSGWRTEIPRAADAFYARRGEGPYGTELLEGAWTKIGDLRRLNLFAHAEAIAHQAR